MKVGLRPYPEYKDSSLRWLGKLPAHWTERRAKYFFREVDERSTSGEEPLMSVSHKTGVTLRKTNVTMFRAESNIGHKICRPGDLAINTLWAWMAALGVSRETGLVSPAYGVYRQHNEKNYHPEFIDYLLRTPPYSAEYLCRSTGITASRLRLYPVDFLRIPVLQPPREEQELIVRYLRGQDALVRKFIRNRRRLIDVLNEQNQAIINQAVTRGLDPNARLKPSGVTWIDNIPAHWDVVRFKNRVGFQEGPGIMAADFRLAGVPLLRISCLAHETATLDGCNYLDPDTVEKKWSHFRVRPGDYLLSASASTGGVSRATEDVYGAVPYTGIIRLWPLSHMVNMEYLKFYIQSRAFVMQINMAKSGVAIEHFGPTHLQDMWICMPPPSEQAVIAENVTAKSRDVYRAIDGAVREIGLIREYHNRVIADVVTGKLDVRHLAPAHSNLDLDNFVGTDAEENLADESFEDAEEELVEEAEG